MDKNPKIAVWRRGIGITCTVVGLLLFAAALFVYLRYTNLNDAHVQERLHNGQLLNHLWQATFFGSIVLATLSLFGLGWSRWAGLIANIGSILCAMMTLGAVCGPYNC